MSRFCCLPFIFRGYILAAFAMIRRGRIIDVYGRWISFMVPRQILSLLRHIMYFISLWIKYLQLISKNWYTYKGAQKNKQDFFAPIRLAIGWFFYYNNYFPNISDHPICPCTCSLVILYPISKLWRKPLCCERSVNWWLMMNESGLVCICIVLWIQS